MLLPLSRSFVEVRCKSIFFLAIVELEKSDPVLLNFGYVDGIDGTDAFFFTGELFEGLILGAGAPSDDIGLFADAVVVLKDLIDYDGL